MNAIAARIPAALEGRRIEIRGKNIQIKAPLATKSGSILFPFGIHNARAVILLAATKNDAFFRPYSLRNVGDELHAQEAWGFSSAVVPPPTVGGEARTGRHSNQLCLLDGSRNYVEALKDFGNQVLSSHPREDFFQ